MNWIKILNIISILIQFSGAFLMYINSPVNQNIALYTREENQKFIKTNNDKNRKLKYGFLLLVIGLFISLITTTII
jgi:hypothetical protein